MYSKKIYYEINYGVIRNNLKELMDQKHISIYTMSKLTNTKYEVVKAYYNDNLYQYSKEILAKFCYILDCNISDIIIYEKSEAIVN